MSHLGSAESACGQGPEHTRNDHAIVFREAIRGRSTMIHYTRPIPSGAVARPNLVNGFVNEIVRNEAEQLRHRQAGGTP
jgi:hypothetical protein